MNNCTKIIVEMVTYKNRKVCADIFYWSSCPQISCHDNICLKSISVDQVWQGVEKLIKQNKLADRESPPS